MHMKKIVLLTVALLFVCSSNYLFAQMDEGAQKAWMNYMTPTKMHEKLAKANGEWKGSVTWWMAPDQEPQQASVTAKNSMIMGGRYQKSEHHGMMMGMPFEGMSLVGYDNATKKFQNIWIDNMGTGIMVMEGMWDDAANAVNLHGTMVDPISGKEMKVREVYKFIDDNNQLLEMYNTVDGKEFKSMEIKFTR